MLSFNLLRRGALCFLLIPTSMFIAACDDEPSAPKDLIVQIQEATARFSDVNTARAAGYVSLDNNACVAVPNMGGMGMHFVNAAQAGINAQNPLSANGRVTGSDGRIDPLVPEVLLYEPRANGAHRFIGVEYLVFEAAWKAAGNTSPPSVAGHVFEFTTDNPATPFDEAHGFEPHYELHLWTVVENPSGIAAPFNPNVSCS